MQQAVLAVDKICGDFERITGMRRTVDGHEYRLIHLTSWLGLHNNDEPDTAHRLEQCQIVACGTRQSVTEAATRVLEIPQHADLRTTSKPSSDSLTSTRTKRPGFNRHENPGPTHCCLAASRTM